MKNVDNKIPEGNPEPPEANNQEWPHKRGTNNDSQASLLPPEHLAAFMERGDDFIETILEKVRETNKP